MALNKSNLVAEIKSTLEGFNYKVTLPSGETEYRQLYDFSNVLEGETGDFNPAEVLISTIVNKTIDHIISSMEIRGVKCSLDTGLNPLFLTGVPAPGDGGTALKVAWAAATTAQAYDKSTQSNDGIGHVQ